jgi:hypothetical protein
MHARKWTSPVYKLYSLVWYLTHTPNWGGGGRGGPNAEDWRKSLTLYLLCAQTYNLEGLSKTTIAFSLFVIVCKGASFLVPHPYSTPWLK